MDRPADIEPTMTRSELRELATRLAADDRSWRHLVRHERDRRVYEELIHEEARYDHRVGIWLICWMDDHDTGFHDHDASCGAVAVAAGRVRDERLAVGGVPRASTYGTGESFDFSESDIHRMSHAGGGPAISIHAYSPPLRRMGAYVIDGQGVLQRTPVSYSEELRPRAAVAA